MTSQVNTIIEFGKGKQVVCVGTINDIPMVCISAAKQPGVPGECAKREGNARDQLLPDELVFTFPTEEQATAVSDALCGVFE